MNDDALRNALVGERHLLQYTSDAAFHAAIYQLAALLPLWVDAIAEQTRGQAAENQRLYERLANAPFPFRPDIALRNPAEGDWDGAS